MVQFKRTGSQSQFRAGVGPLLPLESERCPAFLRPGLMVRANALHYALRIRTLLSTMQRFGVLRERQTHNPMAGLQEEQRRCCQARRYEKTVELVYSTSCAWVRAVVGAERSLSSVRGSRSRSRDVHCSSRCGQPLPCTLRMIGLDPGHDLRCL